MKKRKSIIMKFLFFIAIIFMVTVIGCKNRYSRYGSKNPIESKDLNSAVYNNDGPNFILRFINNPYNISKRIVIVRLDTIIIYRGLFSLSPQMVKVPASLVNTSCRPNLMIVEPSLKDEYYFENKDGIDLLPNDNTITIEFTKSKNFYDNIIFKTRRD